MAYLPYLPISLLQASVVGEHSLFFFVRLISRLTSHYFFHFLFIYFYLFIFIAVVQMSVIFIFAFLRACICSLACKHGMAAAAW